MENKPRGQRNNNPFNIKISQAAWRGELLHNTDGTFEQFKDMYHGIRAGVKLLHNYVRFGYKTPLQIISRFAPDTENDTNKYLRFLFEKGYIKDINEIIVPATIAMYHLCTGITMYESSFTFPYELYQRILKDL